MPVLTPESYDVEHLYQTWKTEGRSASMMLPDQGAACEGKADLFAQVFDEGPVKEDYPEMTRREFNAMRRANKNALEEATGEAKAVCAQCPKKIRERCLIAAVSVENGAPGEMFYEPHGVWGGLDKDELETVYKEFVGLRNDDYLEGNLVIPGFELEDEE